MSSADLDTSVLVTTFRRPRHLELVLESIAAQKGVPRTFEIVVSDDGSEDQTADVVAAFAARADVPVRFTSQPHAGFRLARVRNNAAQLAQGRYLLFLDGDCVLPSHHLAAHWQRRRAGAALLGYCARLGKADSQPLIEHGLTGVNLAGLVTGDEARLLTRRHRRAVWHGLIRHPTKPRLAGGDFGVWRSDFARVNGFDERFEGWGQEDDDLGLRLRAAGVRLASILDATCSLHIWHPTDPTATTRWRDGVNVGYFERRGRLTTCRRGLVDRDRSDILWGLPRDIAASPLGRHVLACLAGCRVAAPGGDCEVEIAVNGPNRRFSHRAECRLLLVAADEKPDRWLASHADRTVDVPPDAAATTIAQMLDEVG